MELCALCLNLSAELGADLSDVRASSSFLSPTPRRLKGSLRSLDFSFTGLEKPRSAIYMQGYLTLKKQPLERDLI